MPRLLLDTHVLIWFSSGKPLAEEALEAIAAAQQSGTLYVSPITAWEAGASQSKPPDRRPYLLGLSPEAWFAFCVSLLRLQVLHIDEQLALETARVPARYGQSDPGDCFLLATAHLHGLMLVTRDKAMRAFSARDSEYVTVLSC